MSIAELKLRLHQTVDSPNWVLFATTSQVSDWLRKRGICNAGNKRHLGKCYAHLEWFSKGLKT